MRPLFIYFFIVTSSQEYLISTLSEKVGFKHPKTKKVYLWIYLHQTTMHITRYCLHSKNHKLLLVKNRGSWLSHEVSVMVICSRFYRYFPIFCQELKSFLCDRFHGRCSSFFGLDTEPLYWKRNRKCLSRVNRSRISFFISCNLCVMLSCKRFMPRKKKCWTSIDQLIFDLRFHYYPPKLLNFAWFWHVDYCDWTNPSVFMLCAVNRLQI